MTDEGVRKLVRGRAVAASLVAVLAVVYGSSVSRIPSPEGPDGFWVANVAAPWLALAFAAGATQTRALGSMFAGAVTDVVTVLAFYSGFLTINAGHSDLLSRLPDWFVFILPWVAIAFTGGCLYGYLGFRWKVHASRTAAVLFAAPFLLEVVVQRVVDGRWPGSWPFFIALGVVGLAATVVLLIVMKPMESRP